MDPHATSEALQALDDVIPPHLRSSRHGLNFMGERYDTIRRGLLPPMDFSLADFEETDPKVDDLLEKLRAQMFTLPKLGTSASNLTEQEKFALAVTMGAPYKTWMDGNMLRMATAVPVGVADRGDGGWIVAIGSVYEDPCHG